MFWVPFCDVRYNFHIFCSPLPPFSLCFIIAISIYLRILVSNTMSCQDDVRVLISHTHQVTGTAIPSGSPECVPFSSYRNCQPFRITRVCPGFKIQELPALPDHPSLSRFQVTGTASLSRFLVEFMFGNRQLLCVVFCRSLFVHLFVAIVLYVLFRFTVFDFSFGIFKLFLMSSAKSYINGEDA